MRTISVQGTPNEILPDGYRMMAKLCAGDSVGLRYSHFRLSGEDGEIHETDEVDFTWSDAPDVNGAMVTGSAVVSGDKITEEVTKIGVINTDGDMVAAATLDEPIPSGTSVLIQRTDLFGQAPSSE